MGLVKEPETARRRRAHGGADNFDVEGFGFLLGGLPRGVQGRWGDAGLKPQGRARVRQVARHRLVAVDQLEQAAQSQVRELQKDTRLSLQEGRGQPVREMRRVR